MKEISIQKLAKMVGDLPVNEKIYVKQHADSELFGITCSNLFESDLIIISHFGGGFASLFDTSTTNEEKDMCSWLQYAFGVDNSRKIVYLLDEKEVFGEQPVSNELWGVTFRVNPKDSPSYRTLAISECPIFSTREAAETWIDERQGMSYDSAFCAQDCSAPKAVLIDNWLNDSDDVTTTNKSSVPTFTARSTKLRDDIIAHIVSILKDNGLSEIELDGMVKDPTFVLWCDGDGNWNESPVKTVSLDSPGISMDVEDKIENVSATLYSRDMDMAFRVPGWLENIRDNMLETIEAKKMIKNKIQLSLIKSWNEYLQDNEEEPRFANVSIRFKDDNSEGKVIISLTDHSEETDDRVFHYARTLQELAELADTNPEATVQNFIILSLNSYSDTIENI